MPKWSFTDQLEE